MNDETLAALSELARFPLAPLRRPAVSELLDGLLTEADLVNSLMEEAASGPPLDLVHPVPRPEERR
jgi:hypothetical protein